MNLTALRASSGLVEMETTGKGTVGLSGLAISEFRRICGPMYSLRVFADIDGLNAAGVNEG